MQKTYVQLTNQMDDENVPIASKIEEVFLIRP